MFPFVNIFLALSVVVAIIAYFRVKSGQVDQDYHQLIRNLANHPEDTKLQSRVTAAGNRYYRRMGHPNPEEIVQRDIDTLCKEDKTR